jgi:hypothetical protein
VAGVPNDSGAVNTADSPVDRESAIDGVGEKRPKPERQSISEKMKERKGKTNMVCFTSNSDDSFETGFITALARAWRAATLI